MDDELLKLECFKTAMTYTGGGQPAIEEAQRIFDFLKGRGQNTRTEVGSGTRRANVVGKDNNIEWPKDYPHD